MITKLDYPKDKFKKALENYIEKGENILSNGQNSKISHTEFEQIEKEFKYWNDEVLEFLKQRFNNP